MKITLLEVENYKRVKKVSIAPRERSTILIAGNNRQGKSSLIGAMSAALGGLKEAASEPIRHGEKRADIRIELDDGELIIHRKFLESGNSSLEVKSKDGKLASPQKILDKLIGTRFLDPLRFSRLPPQEQRQVLLRCVNLSIDLDAHEAERKRVYGLRTDANREAKRVATELAACPALEPVTPINLREAVLRLTELEKAQQEHGRNTEALQQLRSKHIEKSKLVEDLENSLAAAKKDLEAVTKEGQDMAARCKAGNEAAEGIAKEIEQINCKISDSEAHNAKAAAAAAAAKRREELAEELSNREALAKALDDTIAAMDTTKAKALEEAVMPIPELLVEPETLVYRNVPLSQASGAEQLQVSMAIAAALSPDLQDIWVEDGALLDENSLELVDQFAKDRGLRVWLERVGESDADALIMEEGILREGLGSGKD